MTTPSFSLWVPYTIAVCLMLLAIQETRRIQDLKAQLKVDDADLARLTRSSALIGLHLSTLEARDPAYQASKILVAWDPNQSRGVISMQNLPEPAADHTYQLWVLDPGAQTPINAGLIRPESGSRSFAVMPLSAASPGFAITLEPAGGSPEPTSAILFAVPPAQ
jgi:hypothetical protein